MPHAKLAPSAAHRWMNCPGCITLCEQVPPKPSSKYAMEGTAAHELGERCLRIDMDPRAKVGSRITVTDDVYVVTEAVAKANPIYQVGQKLNGGTMDFQVTEEMALAVKMYVDEVNRKKLLVTGGIFKIEQYLSLDWLTPHLGGTGDHIIIEPFGHLYVDDLKYGAGVPVEADDNPQLKIYGLGGIGENNPHMVEDVTVTIAQPRAPHSYGPIRHMEVKAEHLIQWGYDILKPAVEKALSGGLDLCAGGWCGWCDALEVCPEQRRVIQENTAAMFDESLVPVNPSAPLMTPSLLDAEQLSRMLRFAPVFKAFIEGCQAEAYTRLQVGRADAPRDRKLVAGKSSRAWTDETTINTFIAQFTNVSGHTEPKVKSPAQMEKAFKMAGLDHKALFDFVTKTAGKPTMVPVDDKRVALAPAFSTAPGEETEPLA